MGQMSAIKPKQDPFGADKGEIRRWWLGQSTAEKSAGSTVIELAVTLADADLRGGIPGLCARCRSSRNAYASTAQYPNIFCSEQCEQEFVRIALASLTLEDCIRIHGQLDNLLTRAEESAA
jgi:hypothetical protein